MGNRDRDVAALVLRLAVGPMLMAHGYNKVLGGGGLEGTARWFDSLGLQPASVTPGSPRAMIGAGAAVTFGVASPLPATAVVGLMATAAATDHRARASSSSRVGRSTSPWSARRPPPWPPWATDSGRSTGCSGGPTRDRTGPVRGDRRRGDAAPCWPRRTVRPRRPSRWSTRPPTRCPPTNAEIRAPERPGRAPGSGRPVPILGPWTLRSDPC